MTKTESDFFRNIVNQNIFLEKKHNHPPNMKINHSFQINDRGREVGFNEGW
jgi:hypothetical protein